ncbi:MAG: hypothetical protein ACRCXL_16500 [Dermatophilaceae bacterium]
MTVATTMSLVVVDTDVWSHLFANKKRDHPMLPSWHALLTGKTIAIASQTRAEVHSGLLGSNLGTRRSDDVRSTRQTSRRSAEARTAALMLIRSRERAGRR